METIAKIYALADPRDQIIRYVGKTKQSEYDRMRSHRWNAITFRDDSSKGRWLRELYDSDLKPIFTILEECSYANWQEREQYWIAKLRSADIPLLNGTAGGHDMGKARSFLGRKMFDPSKIRRLRNSSVWLDRSTLLLPDGRRVLIDEEDYIRVSKFFWSANEKYIAGWIWVDGKRIKMLMHRFILDAPRNKFVDHKDGNKLDNRKSNLRLCDRKQNNRNVKVRKGQQYKGVCFYKRYGNYTAGIAFNGQQLHLGYFSTAEEAARAYDNAARYYFAEFAWTNFEYSPDDPTTKPVHPKRGTSQYRGVNLRGKVWGARLVVEDKLLEIGTYQTEEDALIAYERACDIHNLPQKKNYPDGLPSHLRGREPVRTYQGTSRYFGVGRKTGRRKWHAQVLAHGKMHYIGYFDTEWEAIQAYEQACDRLGVPQKKNFPDGLPENKPGVIE